MKYCSKCGTELEDGKSFCPKCGYDLNSKLSNTTEDKHKTDVKSVLKNKTVIGLIIACIFVIIFVFVGKAFSNPEKAVTSFQSAINKDDAKALSKVLYTNDERISLKEENVKPLLESFKTTPSELSDTINNLNVQALNLKNGGIENQTSDLYITKAGTTLIFFPKYKIAFKPAFLNITSNIKGADILINGKSVGKADNENFSKQFGPYVPGIYNIEGKAKGNFADLYNKIKIDFIVDGTRDEPINVLHGVYLQVESDYSNNEVYINGKDTGKAVNSEDRIGPIASGVSIYAVTSYGEEKVKSSAVTLSDTDDIIYFDYSDEEYAISNRTNDINNMITGYASSLASALTNGDANELRNIYPASKLDEMQRGYIKTNPNENGNFYEQYVASTVISYKMDADNKSGIVNAIEEFNINENEKNPDSAIKRRSFNNTYKFKYNDTERSYQLIERTSAVETK